MHLPAGDDKDMLSSDTFLNSYCEVGKNSNEQGEIFQAEMLNLDPASRIQ